MEVIAMKSRHMRFLYEQIMEAAYQQAVSPSAQGSQYLPPDLGRLEQELVAIELKRDYIQQAAQLDQPHLNPQAYLPSFNREIPSDISRHAREVVDRLKAMALEINHSDSATLPGGWVSFDSNRLTAAVADIRNFISEYVLQANPVDRPEA